MIERSIKIDYSAALALVTSRSVAANGSSSYFDALGAIAPEWIAGQKQDEKIPFLHDKDAYFGTYKILAEQAAHWIRDQYPEFDNIMPKDIEELDQLIAGMGVPKPGRPEGPVPFPGGPNRVKIPAPESPQAVSIWLRRMKARYNLPDKIEVRFDPAQVKCLTNG